MADSLFARLGGQGRVRPICEALVARMAADPMIGFFFRSVPLARLAEREYEHAAALLGGEVAYRGRPLALAHRRLSILRGQFDRRLAILREVLADFGVAEEVASAWVAHQRRLEGEVMGARPRPC